MANDFTSRIKFVGDFSELQAGLAKVTKGKTVNLTNTAKGINSVGTAAKNSTGLLGNFVSSLGNLGEIIPKVMAFGLATSAIGLFTDAISASIDTIFEYDEALTEMKKVSDLTGESLDKYTDKLAEIGEETARTRTEMVEAATQFIKTGASEQDAAELARVSTLYQNIADSQLSAGESASFITSQMKAFNITAMDSIHIIDAVNEVSNNFAVSSTDISTALSKTSAAMSVLGNSYEETIGMVTGATEIMQGQA